MSRTTTSSRSTFPDHQVSNSHLVAVTVVVVVVVVRLLAVVLLTVVLLSIVVLVVVAIAAAVVEINCGGISQFLCSL